MDGQWSEWGSWADCSATCGNGTQLRMRNCTNPAPEHGGEECEGEGTAKKECHQRECPGNVLNVYEKANKNKIVSMV